MYVPRQVPTEDIDTFCMHVVGDVRNHRPTDRYNQMDIGMYDPVPSRFGAGYMPCLLYKS